jgi:hypothetical protein
MERNKKMKKVRKLDPRLIKLAKITPKEWGKEILDRNTFLLEKVKLLKGYIDKDIIPRDVIPIDVIERIHEKINFGCPHCKSCGMDCGSCLWQSTTIKNDCHNACIHMPFYGVAYTELEEYNVSIAYSAESAWIAIGWSYI